jgi:hypothetical protein
MAELYEVWPVLRSTMPFYLAQNNNIKANPMLYEESEKN